MSGDIDMPLVPERTCSDAYKRFSTASYCPEYDPADTTPLRDRLDRLPARPLQIEDIELIAAAPRAIFPELPKALALKGWRRKGVFHWRPPEGWKPGSLSSRSRVRSDRSRIYDN